LVAEIRGFVPALRGFHSGFEQQPDRNLSFRRPIVFGMRRDEKPAANGKREWAMLGWVITFLVIALIAGLLGFGGIAGVSIEIAKVIFFIAVVLFLISAIVGLARRGRV
jgi:uncharacterized membrane protein YtjA (UPF0391 family)